MKNRTNASHVRPSLISALLFAALSAPASQAHAQTLPWPIDTCSSGTVDSTYNVEETVCLYGDDELYVNSEIDWYPNEPDGENESLDGVNLDTQLYDGNGNLLWDSGDNSASEGSYDENYVYTEPTAEENYSAQTTYDEYFCDNEGDPCTWNYGMEGEGNTAYIIPVYVYRNLECWGQSGYPGNGYTKASWNDWTPQPNTGSTGTGSGNIYYGQSISDTGPCGALEITNTQTSSGTEYNVLAAVNVCGGGTQTTTCPTISNLEVDMNFVMPSNTTYEALEFDPDVTTSDGYTYTESVECDFSTGLWKYYDSSQGAWYPFSDIGLNDVPSCSLTSGRHHLQLYVTLVDTSTTHTYQYQEMFVDGQTIFDSSSDAVNACDANTYGTPCYPFTQYIGVEQQVDNGLQQTITAYYDWYNLTVW